MTIKKQTQKRLEDFFQIIQQIQFNRDPTNFIEYLVGTDFFQSPASVKFHDSNIGGLYDHCKRMYLSLKTMNQMLNDKYSDETLFYMAFGHDICKINTYKQKEFWHKDEKNNWKSEMGWEVKDDFPLGHGQKSLFILSKYVELTDEESLAIRWHMGGFEAGIMIPSGLKMSFDAANMKSRLVRMVMSADNMAIVISQDVEQNTK